MKTQPMKIWLLALIFGATAAFAQTPSAENQSALPATPTISNSAQTAQANKTAHFCSDATFDELKGAFNELEGLLNEAQENPEIFKNTDLAEIQQFVEEKGALEQKDFSESDALAVLEKINGFNNELAAQLLE